MRLMRDTSVRRRSPRARVYRGAPSGKRIVRDAPTLLADDGDPDAVVCEACGARVRRLAGGQPRGHAPGGYRTSPAKGRYTCPGAGNIGGYVQG